MKRYEYSEKIEPSRMIEIDKNIEMLTTFSFNDIDREYLEMAIKMPTSEVKTFLEFYDNSSPKYDEIKFILMLMAKYDESRENIIKRIRQVRRVMRYEEKHQECKNLSKKKEK